VDAEIVGGSGRQVGNMLRKRIARPSGVELSGFGDGSRATVATARKGVRTCAIRRSLVPVIDIPTMSTSVRHRPRKVSETGCRKLRQRDHPNQ